MSNEKSFLIDDIFDLNKRISENLWHVANEKDQPSNLSPHVIFPLKRDKNTVRISEQEARVICCSLLNDLNLYYSVETPTYETYVQKGKKPEGMSAQTDLTIFGFDGQCFRRLVNTEFKAHNPTQANITKDIEKLVREDPEGNWFHLLKNTDRGTFKAPLRKFETSFLENSHGYHNTLISIVFCFCVLAKQQAYMRHFFYEPGKKTYEEYVRQFFDPSKLKAGGEWQLSEGVRSVK